MDIEARIRDLDDKDLERLLSTLNFGLSGSGICEGKAFELLAEVEAMAIRVSHQRHSEDSINPLGGLSDERQAGYFA